METKETAIAEALVQAHASLLKDVQQLEETIRGGSADGLESVRAGLDATEAHIAEHFRFEEQNGYMNVVRQREPRLEHAIQRLAEEHRELAQSLAALREEARTARSLSDSFLDEVRHWLERVRQHEWHENDLIQDALVADLSAED
jgi:hemerythrin-like domain-containing protein